MSDEIVCLENNTCAKISGEVVNFSGPLNKKALEILLQNNCWFSKQLVRLEIWNISQGTQKVKRKDYLPRIKENIWDGRGALYVRHYAYLAMERGQKTTECPGPGQKSNLEKVHPYCQLLQIHKYKIYKIYKYKSQPRKSTTILRELLLQIHKLLNELVIWRRKDDHRVR